MSSILYSRYALVEFDSREEAKDAIKKMNGKELLGNFIERNY
jgi:RNA recognition motif-containing protein